MRVILLCFSLLLCLPCAAVELLVRATESAHPDKNTDRVGRTKIGMVIDVRPDGFQWGTSEGLPQYVIIKIPGLSADAPEIVKLREREMDATGTNLFRPRKYMLATTNFPAAVKLTLSTGGVIDTSTHAVKWTVLKTNILDITKSEWSPVAEPAEKEK